ncbi:MAG: SufS family cysteine desulfurase [Candidatus Kerfeldbacteria bacterium]|nr:SufS family cysteine desulfurase [Candidatus Kerfeldbacteria bacterium]
MLSDNIRRQFPVFAEPVNKNLAFLDNAASTQKPAAVLEAIDRCYRTSYANVHRGIYRLSEAATTAYENARVITARFLQARQLEEIIFTRNATEALNLVAQTYSQRLKPGDEVLLSQLEHHANLVPWQQMGKRYGFTVRFLPLTPDGRLDLDKLDEYLTTKTKVVALSAMSNVLGTVTELKVIIPRARALGALVVVDAAQMASHRPLDVQTLDCDFLAFSGHKVFGPSGVGVLYGKRARLEDLPPFQYGGSMINEVQWDDSTWADIPAKFEAGTPAIAEVIGLGAALEFVMSLGWQDYMTYEDELTRYALPKLLAVTGLHLLGPSTPQNRGPVFAFTIAGVHPHDLSSVLDDLNIAVRSGHHCAQPLHRLYNISATTRASATIYNSKEDFDRLIEGIEKAKRLFS